MYAIRDIFNERNAPFTGQARPIGARGQPRSNLHCKNVGSTRTAGPMTLITGETWTSLIFRVRDKTRTLLKLSRLWNVERKDEYLNISWLALTI